MRAILVGNGSVGKRHLVHLKAVASSISVIDPNPSNLVDSSANVAKFISIEDLNKSLVQSADYFGEDDFAIVSNWGPDHLRATSSLVSMGMKRFLVEKPLASSLRQLSQYENLVSKNVLIWCNYHLRSSSGKQAILKFQKTQNLDSPISISVTGGAKCLSTTGIHWIDFAVNLFHDSPYQINGNVVSHDINPRNTNLSFLEGLAFFRFSQGRTLLLDFHNASQSDAIITILWRHHMAEIRSGKIRFYSSSIDNSDELPNTRSVTFDKLLAEENFAERGFEALFSEFVGANKSQSHLLTANRALLLALCSSELQKTVSWDEEIPMQLRDFDWRIS